MIGTANASTLAPAWVLNTGGDVSATPAVDGDYVYFPDFAGNLFKADKDTGAVIWQRTIGEYLGLPNHAVNFSRTTPTIYGDLLILGTQGGRFFLGAHMIAVNKFTGDPVWVTQMASGHPAAMITQSPTIAGDKVIVGTASYEELFAAVVPGYTLTFRGSVVQLDAATGAIVWETFMAPQGFTGNAVWGSSPAVDHKRGQVYIATGNNYGAPQAFLDCVAAAGADPEAQRACLDPYPDNFFDAVVALDLKTGAVNWANTVLPFDVWTVECLFELPTCPDPEGPDFDFGQAPMLITIKAGGKPRDLVAVGQKSGMFWALDPDSGQAIWVTQTSPGGVAGGVMWGSSFDGDRIYVSSANSEYQSWVLPDGSVTNGGIFTALDPATGSVLWQLGNPVGNWNAGGAVSSANGVVYACSQDPEGYMFAIDGNTGNVLWAFASGGSCNAGAAISNGMVYWGSGYGGFGAPNTANDKFYAFGVN